MLGGVFAILAAASFGFNNAALRRGVLSGSVFQALAITVPMGVPLFLLAGIATGHIDKLWSFPAEAYFWLAAAGVMHFVWGRYCNYRSTKAIGGNLSGPWKQAQLIIALILAIVLLGETLTPLKILGIALIVGGVVATSRAKHKKKPKTVDSAGGNSESSDKPKRSKLPDFEPNYAEGYTFALLSATGYGISPVLVRMGLENQGPGFSIAGGLISYTAAALVVGIIILVGRQWGHIRSMQPVAAKWFSLAGALVGLSQGLRYTALAIAPVTVVTPIQSTSAVFRVLFGWLINREHEVFGLWVYLGVLLSIAGVVALTLSTEIIVAHVDLPQVLVDIAGWQWP
jgi:drug/metabolite transporter (DMT)-like permease